MYNSCCNIYVFNSGSDWHRYFKLLWINTTICRETFVTFLLQILRKEWRSFLWKHSNIVLPHLCLILLSSSLILHCTFYYFTSNSSTHTLGSLRSCFTSCKPSPNTWDICSLRHFSQHFHFPVTNAHEIPCFQRQRLLSAVCQLQKIWQFELFLLCYFTAGLKPCVSCVISVNGLQESPRGRCQKCDFRTFILGL